MKRVSIKDVAAKAGVSTALVSYVLNRRHTERISKETAEKIKEVVKELNYQPNKIAQSLKSNKTKTIALLVADIANPFASQIARIIEDETNKKGYVALIGSSDEKPMKLEQLVDLFLDRQVDGFIIAPTQGSEETIQKLVNNKTPLVLIDRYFKEIEVPFITTNNYGISYKAIEYLIKSGRKNIGILAYETQLIHLNERVEGYKGALQEYDFPVLFENIKYINEALIQEEVDQAIDKMLSSDNKVDALFFTTNKLAIAGLKKLTNIKIEIPEELAILSFDESDAFDIFKVPITHIKQPLYEISKGAVETLLKIIENKELKLKNRVHNSKLVIKKST